MRGTNGRAKNGKKRSMIEDLTRLIFALASLILSRWFLELSTPLEDLRWACSQLQGLWSYARWYGGYEVMHQLRAMRLLAYA
jgi:hypothetical protein